MMNYGAIIHCYNVHKLINEELFLRKIFTYVFNPVIIVKNNKVSESVN